ncbi:MAG: MFS transporter [bacterium]
MNKKQFTFGLIYLLIFLVSIANAIAGYIQSSYLGQFMSLSTIGLFLAAVTIITIIISLGHPKSIIKYSNYRMSLFLSILVIVSSIGLSFASSLPIVILSFIIRYVGMIFLFISFDIFLENISSDHKTGRIRTRYMTVINLAWVVSPILMGQIVGDANNYGKIFLISALIFVPIFFFLLSQKKNLVAHVRYPKYNPLKSIWKIKNNKDIFSIFNASLVLNMFYALATFYIPIYLNQTIGLSWQSIGIIFTIMLIPFIIIEIPAGYLADKYIGEKEMLIAGNIIMAFAVLLMYLFPINIVAFWAIVLFLSRVGAALAESMQESYFYKKIDAEDVDIINLFRQSISLGYLIMALAGFVILFFASIEYLFLFMAIVFILNIVNLIALKDTK